MDTDDELLRLTPTQPDAFGSFYERHERVVLGYFMRRTREPEVAADLTAETFAAALIAAKRGRYRAGREPAIAWLFGIARHKLLRSYERRRVDDRARRKLHLPRLELDDDAVAIIERLAGEDEASALLAALPPDQAAAVRARVLDDASYEQIAVRLRCSQSVARKRVSRGLEALRIPPKEPA